MAAPLSEPPDSASIVFSPCARREGCICRAASAASAQKRARGMPGIVARPAALRELLAVSLRSLGVSSAARNANRIGAGFRGGSTYQEHQCGDFAPSVGASTGVIGVPAMSFLDSKMTLGSSPPTTLTFMSGKDPGCWTCAFQNPVAKRTPMSNANTTTHNAIVRPHPLSPWLPRWGRGFVGIRPFGSPALRACSLTAQTDDCSAWTPASTLARNCVCSLIGAGPHRALDCCADHRLIAPDPMSAAS